MPNTPYKPITRQRSSAVPIVSSIGGAAHIPVTRVSSRVRAPAVVFNTQSVGLSEYEVSGGFSGTVTLNCPALTKNSQQSLSASVPLTNFPSPFTLVPGTSGMVLVSSSLSPTNNVPSSALISNISSTFLYGANSTPTTGPLTPGLAYTQPTVSVTLTVASQGEDIAAFSFEMVVQANLLGAVISAR